MAYLTRNVKQMNSNQRIKNYLTHLEEKSDREMNEVIAAMESCHKVESDRKQYYLCLSKQGLSLRQIGILEGITKQSIKDWIDNK